MQSTAHLIIGLQHRIRANVITQCVSYLAPCRRTEASQQSDLIFFSVDQRLFHLRMTVLLRMAHVARNKPK